LTGIGQLLPLSQSRLQGLLGILRPPHGQQRVAQAVI
jgi:hypothetical protein